MAAPVATPKHVQDAVMLVNRSIQELGESISALSGSGGGGGGGGGLAGLKGAFTQAAAKSLIVVSAVKEFGAALGQFVGLFNPVVVKQFNFAVNDMQAAIGEALTPIMNAAIPVVRFLGDVFAGIAREVQPLVNGGLVVVGQLFQSLGSVIQQLAGQTLSIMLPAWNAIIGVFQSLIPVLMPIVQLVTQVAGVLLRFQAGILNLVITPLRLLAAVLAPVFELVMAALQPFLEGLTLLMDVFGSVTGLMGELASMLGEIVGDLLRGVFSFFIEGLRSVISLVREFAGWVRGLLGIADKNKALELGDSRGKAVTNTSQTNVAGLLTKMQTSAFALGGSNPSVEVAKNTAEANTLLRGVQGQLDKLMPAVENGLQLGLSVIGENIERALQFANPYASLDRIPPRNR